MNPLCHLPILVFVAAAVQSQTTLERATEGSRSSEIACRYSIYKTSTSLPSMSRMCTFAHSSWLRIHTLCKYAYTHKHAKRSTPFFLLKGTRKNQASGASAESPII
jgi:hypothetical protein